MEIHHLARDNVEDNESGEGDEEFALSARTEGRGERERTVGDKEVFGGRHNGSVVCEKRGVSNTGVKYKAGTM